MVHIRFTQWALVATLSVAGAAGAKPQLLWVLPHPLRRTLRPLQQLT